MRIISSFYTVFAKEQTVDTVIFHESEDSLELYALHRLPDSEVERVENHLLICEGCRDRLEEVSAFAFSMRQTLRDEPVIESNTRWFSRWFGRWFGGLRPQLALGGAFAVMVMAVGIYRISADAHIVPVASLQLTALRGSDVKTVVRARELDLAFTDAPASSRLDIVDVDNVTVWTGTLRPVAERAEARIAQARITQVLSPGEYFARVYNGAGQPLHEYQFEVVK
jgi:hypothetical protein